MLYQRRKHTFAVAFILAAFAASAGAQVIGKTMTVATMPACNSPKNFGLVTDATNATTLGAGGGSAAVWVTCASGSWAIDEVAAVSDLSAYLPVSGTTAAAIVIQGSGAGNDISLITVDDLFLTPTDALTAAVGGDVAVTTTAGAIGLTAGGTTQDITLTSVDDVILVPADALTATVGGAVAVTTTAGAIGLTAGGTTQDITLTSVDDVILAATDDTTIAGDAFGVNTTTAVIDAGGGADEITVAAASTTVTGSLILPIASAPPAACASGTKGTIYYDSDINKLCVCNATAYVLVDDSSTTTGCS